MPLFIASVRAKDEGGRFEVMHIVVDAYDTDHATYLLRKPSIITTIAPACGRNSPC